MNREQIVDVVEKLRAGIPNLVLRTTFINGFPGETDEQFAELVEFVDDMQFERMGAFTYSYEASTPSAALPNHVDEEVMNARREILMGVQQNIAFNWNEARVGTQMDVIIDQAVPGEENAWAGRSYADAPDVDSLVWVSGENLTEGQIVKCEIVATQGYDLIAASRPSVAVERHGRNAPLVVRSLRPVGGHAPQ